MKPLQERLNTQLDQQRSRSELHWQPLSGLLLPESDYDLEIEALLALAWNVRMAPQLRVTPTFASQMEGRLVPSLGEGKRRKGAKKRMRILKRWLMRIHR